MPYLQSLGISHVYLSPIYQARVGSSHGYDVTDHTVINPELGTEEEFRALAQALRDRNMGLVFDVVPNHMGIGDESNQWWQDVLENGPSSAHASHFDIDWNPPKTDLANKVLLPILGDQYGKVLESGAVQLEYDKGALRIRVYDKYRYPLAPRTWITLLDPVLEAVRKRLSPNDADFVELEGVLASLRNMPSRAQIEPAKIQDRMREKEKIKRRLFSLTEKLPTIAQALQEQLKTINGTVGQPRSFDALESLLAQQAYRLCHWRVASDEVNYRRFFDVNELAAVRVEVPEVFDAVHALTLRLMSDKLICGLRIDHPDGLFDPETYFIQLQEYCAKALGAEWTPQGISSMNNREQLPFYIVVEKILCGAEHLRNHWAVYGTTGYEFLNLLNGIFIDSDGLNELRLVYRQYGGPLEPPADIIYECKKLIIEISMAGELHVLARHLDRISEQHRWSRDFTLANLQEGLREVIACFPVYRTYVRSFQNQITDEDHRTIVIAVRSARRRNPAMSESLFDFIQSVLLMQDPEGLSEAQRNQRREFVMRFQQLTGPVMAKGLEDTASYRIFPLASINEVGSTLDRGAVSSGDFHQRMAIRQRDWPAGLSATSTHDTKRSEDVRARLNVLADIPKEWSAAIIRWQNWNQPLKRDVEGMGAPSFNDEILLYQTLIGAWPLEPLEEADYGKFIERIQRYMEKATKEAKVHTSWIAPNTAYDEAVSEFVKALLTQHEENRFLHDFVSFQSGIAFGGMLNSLSQLLVKLTAPGIPDIYQGTELWDFSLVDPDNRRTVAFEPRAQLLKELVGRSPNKSKETMEELLAHWQDGRIKLYILSQVLQLRRRRMKEFLSGDYIGLEAWGSRKNHVLAYVRRLDASWILTAVPRFATRLKSGFDLPLGEKAWESDVLVIPKGAPQQWTHLLTGEKIETTRGVMWDSLRLSSLFQRSPVSLLEAQS